MLLAAEGMRPAAGNIPGLQVAGKSLVEASLGVVDSFGCTADWEGKDFEVGLGLERMSCYGPEWLIVVSAVLRRRLVLEI